MHSDSPEPSEGAAQVVSRGVSTAEKRAEYRSLGMEWPKYLDGTNQKWRKDPRHSQGGYWSGLGSVIGKRTSDRQRNLFQSARPGICPTKGCIRPRQQFSTGAYGFSCKEHNSERGHKYRHRPGGARHRDREKAAQGIEAKIQEVLGNHPELKEFLNVKED